jgi:hypothetical protein
MNTKQYLTIAECCEKLGLEKSVVYATVTKHNLWFRKGFVDYEALVKVRETPTIRKEHPKTEIDWSIAAGLFKNATDTKAVAFSFGVSLNTLYTRCRKDNGISLKEFIKQAIQ